MFVVFAIIKIIGLIKSKFNHKKVKTDNEKKDSAAIAEK